MERSRKRSPDFRERSSLLDSASSSKPVFVSFFLVKSIDLRSSSSYISSRSFFFSISRISLCFLTWSSLAMSSSRVSRRRSCRVTLSFSRRTCLRCFVSSTSSISSVRFWWASSSYLEKALLPWEVISIRWSPVAPRLLGRP